MHTVGTSNIIHFPSTCQSSLITQFGFTDMCSAEVSKKLYNHVTRIINHVMDVFVWLIVSCMKSEVFN